MDVLRPVMAVAAAPSVSSVMALVPGAWVKSVLWSRKMVPMSTWKPWKPVAMKKVEP